MNIYEMIAYKLSNGMYLDAYWLSEILFNHFLATGNILL